MLRVLKREIVPLSTQTNFKLIDKKIIWIIDIRNNLVYFGADLHCLCHNLLFIMALN